MWTSKQTGFTIVELLIVIVVIGILAAITIVAYNGIQQRANNTKTTQALQSWIKAMKLYKVDNSRWPPPGGFGVCLGEGYKYGVSGTDSSGTAQCLQSGAYGELENASYNTKMKPYLGSTLPTPAFVTARYDDTTWIRGLRYVFAGGAGNVVYIQAAFAGQIGSCPIVDGTTASLVVWGGNTKCTYVIGDTTDT